MKSMHERITVIIGNFKSNFHIDKKGGNRRVTCSELMVIKWFVSVPRG